jgi:hypothetical protein
MWSLLEQFQDIFAWHKGKLGRWTIGEHTIDTQGLSPCQMTTRRLSYYEETMVNRQIQAFVNLGKMCKNASKYACKVTLSVNMDGSRRFCGDYYPLNAQIRRDSFPMPLIDDVLD